MLRRGGGNEGRALVLGILAILARAGAASAQTGTLPAPWNAQDIGNPAIAGSSSFDQGQFAVSAAGSDIWGASDQFHFVYQQISGDVDVIARVDSVAMAHAWSKAGVMIRSSLSANAAHGFALASAGKGLAFQRRPDDGGTSASTAGPLLTAPQWVRLLRAGTRLTASYSEDGVSWTSIGSATIALGSVAYVGIATTSHNPDAATTAVISQVAVVSLELPVPQQAIDIGGPAIHGSVTYRQGAYGVHAGGADIWGTSDQFHFIYQPISGDFDMIVRVKSVTYADKWSKTGVMIRETLTPDSRHAFALASAGKGYAFQRRVDPGGFSTNTAGPLATAPGWVRLVRTGSQIEAFQSADGTTWASIGVDAIPMTDTVYVGIATTSHNVATATDAELDSFKITSIGAASNQPPQVAITSPADGTTFPFGASVTVSAAANDSDGTISRVDFFAGATPIGSDDTAPYSVTWSPSASGTYSLTAVAVDNDGAAVTSGTVTAVVSPAANQPPAVSLTAPANGATYSSPATMALSATASDPDGTIARVEFYNGATLLNSDTAAPYTFTWSSVPEGTYTIRAVAYDDRGASASSASSTVTVSTAPPTAVVFGASTDHATSVLRYELRIFASGADPNAATPIATSDLGKPAPDGAGDITVDQSAFFSGLASGSYVAAVAAVGSQGSSTSAGVNFTR